MNSTLKPSNVLAQLGALSGPQWVELGIKHAPQVVAGLAIVGIAWQAARLTWLFLSPAPVAPAGVADVPMPPAQGNSSAAPSPQSIAEAHLFGIAGVSSGPADPNSLPQTQMNLVLAGTMALEDPEAGYAIVGENPANAKFYRVGSMINGGARLHSVYPDRVIIERNGTLETLVLPRGAPSVAPAPMVRNVATTNSVGDNLRRIVASNPSALGELLRAQPVFSNGVQKGYRIYPGRDRQQFARLGLQPGDLVTSINGATLDDPNRGSEILNTLTASSTAQVSIERNGATLQMTLDMAHVSFPEGAADGPGSSSGTNSPAQSGRLNGVPGNVGPRGVPSGGIPGGLPDASAQ